MRTSPRDQEKGQKRPGTLLLPLPLFSALTRSVRKYFGSGPLALELRSLFEPRSHSTPKEIANLPYHKVDPSWAVDAQG